MSGSRKKKYTIGLIAENLTETDSFSKKQIKKAGIQLEKTPYLGKVISVDSQIIHILEVEKILPEPVLKGLVKRN